MVKTLSIASVAACALLLAACSGEDDGDKSAQPEQPAKPAATASAGGAAVSVKADKTHAVQPGDEITLTIEVTGFRLAPGSIGGENEAGAGHYRVYLDDASGDDYLAVGAEGSAKVVIPADISDGSHDLRVVLHGNDRQPLEPAAEGSVLLIVYRL